MVLNIVYSVHDVISWETLVFVGFCCTAESHVLADAEKNGTAGGCMHVHVFMCVCENDVT